MIKRMICVCSKLEGKIKSLEKLDSPNSYDEGCVDGMTFAYDEILKVLKGEDNEI
ncbi:MAG: hypothetical protein ACRC0G_14540 [Fusobacteriaceae bacterium]